MNGDISSTEGVSRPRQVLLKKGPQGYGFNLHGEKGVHGQFISAVDEESPADIGGLLIGDRVVEVNGHNVEGATHAEVVSKIKEYPNEAKLLVVDKITDAYYKKIGRPITADLVGFESPTVVETSENETVKENGESHEHEAVQDTVNEEELAVRQMEAATLESSPQENFFEEPETKSSPEEDEVPKPEPEPEQKEEIDQEESAPEPEIVHSTVDNSEVESTPPAVPEPEPEPEPEPVQPTPVVAPVQSEPVIAPVPDLGKKPEKSVPMRKQIKQQKADDWKNRKQLFDNL